MTEKVAKVMKGFINLNEIEKEELLKEINYYQKMGPSSRRIIEEEVRMKSSLGPKNSICEYCGR